jgi:hypothetical protein
VSYGVPRTGSRTGVVYLRGAPRRADGSVVSLFMLESSWSQAVLQSTQRRETPLATRLLALLALHVEGRHRKELHPDPTKCNAPGSSAPIPASESNRATELLPDAGQILSPLDKVRALFKPVVPIHVIQNAVKKNDPDWKTPWRTNKSRALRKTQPGQLPAPEQGYEVEVKIFGRT